MAKWISHIIADARGSVGDVVFLRTRAGAIMARRTKPTVNNTPWVIANKELIVSVANAWRSLTDSESRLWHDFSLEHYDGTTSLGTPKFLNSFSWFSKCNGSLARFWNFVPVLRTPPERLPSHPIFRPEIISATRAPFQIIVRVHTITPWEWFKVRATPPLPITRHSLGSTEADFIGFIRSNEDENITAEYTARQGTLNPLKAQCIFIVFQAFDPDTGIDGPRIRVRVPFPL